jgi:hypothetical protein
VTYLLLLRAHWKLAILGLLCLLLAFQTVRLGAANNRADRIQINLNEARAELKRISDAKNEQAKRTEEAIRLSQKRIQIGDKIARGIEEAPTAPNCSTPKEILQADL